MTPNLTDLEWRTTLHEVSRRLSAIAELQSAPECPFSNDPYPRFYFQGHGIT